jgi:monoamine oxidase
MGRSPLFRTLKRLVRRSVPGTLQRGPSRRDVLRGLLAAGALAPIASACGDNTGPGPQPSIAIVGGGIAGMACAHFLALAGVRAEVYEASMRIGGRMYTARGMLQGGQLCELGGELVDTDHVVLPALAASYGCTLDDLHRDGLRDDTFYFDHGVLSDSAIVAAFTPVAMKMQMAVAAGDMSDAEFARIDNMSIPQWLEQEAGLAPSALIRRLLEVAYLEEFGLEVAEQSAWNLITLIGYDEPDPFRVFGDSDERFHIHEGNDAVPARIADALADQVHLDHTLTKVVAGEQGYTLTFTTSDGDVTVEADHVVYALPFTKLREVDLAGAQLSDDKLTIITQLGYGTNAKLMLQFDSRPWETNQMSSGGCITDAGELQTTWATSRGQGGVQGILTNFVGGTRGIAIGEGTAESQAQRVLPWIDEVFPGTSAHYIADSAIRQHWPSYPYVRASYASYKVGQWAFLGMEGAREGNQHFCGEHCSENFQGYMEGGAETGAMVAGEILDDLGIVHPPVLAGLLSTITDSPRGSYHAGFGQRIKLRDLRRG